MCDGVIVDEPSQEMNADNAKDAGCGDGESKPCSPESLEAESIQSNSTKRTNEPEWEAEPDLYGIRRSGRNRIRTAPFQITSEQKIPRILNAKGGSHISKSSDESGSVYEESSSDSESLSRHAKKEKQARKKAKKRKSKSREHSSRKTKSAGGKHKKSKKHKRSLDRKRRRSHSSEGEGDSEDNHSSDDRRSSNRRRATKVKSYKEDDAYRDVLSDSDEGTKGRSHGANQTQLVDYENTDGIDRILDYRIDNVGRTGHLTTIYSTEQPSVAEQTEEQFLIKWQSWSHFHNTWESVATLELQKARGMKKLENYIKRRREYDEWCISAEPESRAIAQYQLDMQRTLNEEYTKVERVVDKRKDKSGQLEYFVKWSGLPYVECTWEAADLMERYFMTEILNYEDRQASKKLPMSAPSSQRYKFQPLDAQPDYVGSGNEDLKLRDYQITGVNWLASSWCSARSCILADEMGLGKTIQTISFLSWIFNQHNNYGPFLIVVPLSTMAAWLREFDLWAKEINVIPYIGDMKSRAIIRETEWIHKSRRLKFNAIVTTYELLMKDKVYLHNMQWSVLVVDEAHRLKNDDSLLYKSLIEFSTQHRLLITGTPLQNSLRELWALMHFIEPAKFDSWAEFEENNQPNKGGFEGYSKLHKTIKPYLLRRLKKEVEKSLPAKVEQILRVDMSKLQKQYYKWILTRNFEELNRGLKGSTNSLLNIIVDLKKCCNHPWLIRPLDPSHEPSDEEKLQQIVKGGGKLWLLDKLLVRLYETKHRVLIFSQMVMMLDILAEYLTLRHFNFQRLDGSINGEQRKQALDSFNSEKSKDFCFLLSTRAGGLGINLATADTVIIFDSDWNPQNDIQAQSRAHRIGQKKQVNIYRLVTKFSVEEDIIERAKKKMVLDHLVIQRMDTSGRTVINDKADTKHPFNKEELNSILKFGAAELFKEADGEEEDLLDFDIDEFLQRAETREESDQPQTAGEELLAGFKVANFNYDDDEDAEEENNAEADTEDGKGNEKQWADIIPTSMLEKVADEETAKAQSEMFLPPRQRNKTKAFQINFSKHNRDASSSSEDESDEETLGSLSHAAAKPSKAGGKRSSKDFRSWSDSEIRGFVRSFRKFPNAENRLQEVAEDADLHEKSMNDLQKMWHKMKECCEAAVSEANKENAGVKTSKNATFKLKGANVNATLLMKSQEDYESLAKSISVLDSPYNYVLKCSSKRRLPNWDVIWEAEQDNHLMIGVYMYGNGNWEAIKNDDRLELHDKMMLDSEQKPQAKHLQGRVDYLLRLLDMELNPKKTAHRAGAKSPDKTKEEQDGVSKERRAAKRERKQQERAQKKEKKERESAAKKQKIKSKERIEDDYDDSSSEDEDAEDGSEEGEVKVKEKSHAHKHNNINISSPLKFMWVPSSEKSHSLKDQRKPTAAELSADIPATHSYSSLQGKVAVLNSAPVSIRELDLKSPAFQLCKEAMRSVKKYLQKMMQSSQSSTDKDEDVNALYGKYLVRIGDRVIEILKAEKSVEKAKERKIDLWNFVAQFSKLDAEALHAIYLKNCKKRKANSAEVDRTGKDSKTHGENVPSPDGNDHPKKVRESIFEKKSAGRRSMFSRPTRPPSPSGPPQPRKRIFERPPQRNTADSYAGNNNRFDSIRNDTDPHHITHGGNVDKSHSHSNTEYSRVHDGERRHFKEREYQSSRDSRWKEQQAESWVHSNKRGPADSHHRNSVPDHHVPNSRDPRMSRTEQLHGGYGSASVKPDYNANASSGYNDYHPPHHYSEQVNVQAKFRNNRFIGDTQSVFVAPPHDSDDQMKAKGFCDIPNPRDSFEDELEDRRLERERERRRCHGAIPIELERPSSVLRNDMESFISQEQEESMEFENPSASKHMDSMMHRANSENTSWHT